MAPPADVFQHHGVKLFEVWFENISLLYIDCSQ